MGNNYGGGNGYTYKTFVASGNVLPSWYNSYTNWYDGLNIYIYGSSLPSGIYCKVRISVIG